MKSVKTPQYRFSYKW